MGGATVVVREVFEDQGHHPSRRDLVQKAQRSMAGETSESGGFLFSQVCEVFPLGTGRGHRVHPVSIEQEGEYCPTELEICYGSKREPNERRRAPLLATARDSVRS